MVELTVGGRPVDLPYTVRIPEVSEEMFNELVDEDTKAELLDGVMIVHSPASPRHNKIAGFIRRLMAYYADEKSLGEVFGPDDLIHLATCRKFAPDAFFLDARDVPRPLPEMEFEVVPGLVIEVLSPSNRGYDLEDKRSAYREAKVRELWLVDPDEQQIVVDRRRGKKYSTITVAEGRLTSAVVKGFWLETSWLWAAPLPGLVACLREILAEQG